MNITNRRVALSAILLITAAYWCGVLGISLNSDDYQYIASMAPIHSIGDVFRPFVSHDANPSFFRPLANMTMAADFLLFGWSGMGFHLTNLLFHLAATLLVFYFVRDIFDLSEKESLWTALIFGILASHEYNLVVDTARADVMVAIFVMLVLLLQKRATRGWAYQAGALGAYGLALCSKEIAIMVVPFLLVIAWVRDGRDAQGRKGLALQLTSYLAVTILFYFYHAHFTASALASQPLAAEGAHSITALLRNGGYALGYIVLPLDLETATSLLTRYRTLTMCVGAILCLALIAVMYSNRSQYKSYMLPLVFSLLTGSVLLLNFERWRVYLPSVGIITIGVLLICRMKSTRGRCMSIALCVTLLVFDVYRGLSAQSEWRTSTAIRDQLKSSLTQLLASTSHRPLTIGFLTTPSKLGSASVMQLGLSALVQRAEADRISLRNRESGTTTGVRLDAWTAVEVNSLSSNEGYRGLTVQQTGTHSFLIAVPDSSHLQLYPTGEIQNHIDRRDKTWHVSDTLRASEEIGIVRRVTFGIVKAVEVNVLDTSATLLSFDGNHGFNKP